jgi:hypothetical protein
MHSSTSLVLAEEGEYLASKLLMILSFLKSALQLSQAEMI